MEAGRQGLECRRAKVLGWNAGGERHQGVCGGQGNNGAKGTKVRGSSLRTLPGAARLGLRSQEDQAKGLGMPAWAKETRWWSGGTRRLGFKPQMEVTALCPEPPDTQA